MLPNSKLYVLVRGDIPPGYQLAQSCHAAFRFAKEYPEVTAQWMDVSEYICCLDAGSEEELKGFLKMAEVLGIPASEFREPDLEDQLTAVALAPTHDAKILCGNLSLALRGVA